MTGQSTTPLERRRETLRTRAAAAAASQAKVTSLDEQLETNSAARREHGANLRAALETVSGLRKSIKDADKQRGKLRTARKNARRAETKAHQRASTAEAKYDRALLADLVRREKDRDLSKHTSTKTPAAPVIPTPPAAPAAALPPAQSTAAPADPPAPVAQNGTAPVTRARATRARSNASRSTGSARATANNG